jgi:two-component system, cell cycle sensor histidine kinase and response regulator CckA
VHTDPNGETTEPGTGPVAATRDGQLFAQHPDPMFELDADGRFVAVNAAFVELTGRSEDELLSMTYFPLVHPDDRERSIAELRAAFDGEVRHYELRVGDPRSPRIMASTKLPVVVDGEVATVYGISRDITAVHRTRRALEDSELRYRGLFEGARIGISIVQRDGRYIDANPTFLGMLGYELDELRQLDVVSVTHPDDRAQTAVQLSQVSTGVVEDVHVEKRYLSRTGQVVWARVNVSRIADADGTWLYNAAFVEDLTELRRHERQLDRQAALLDEAQDAIIAQDESHRVTFWNKGAERLYGWSREEVLGTAVRELLHTDPADRDEAYRTARREGRWTGELRQRRRDGTPLVVSVRLSRVEDEGDEPGTVLAIASDVTAQRALEQQLLRAQRMDSLGTLAGGVAHDLNNVLSPILLASELLQLEATDDQQVHLLQAIQRGAQRGSALVSQVLTFARGVEGERIPVDVAALLADVRAIVRDTFPKNIEVRLDVPSDIGAITADSTQIQQVLLNLAVNARDAMPEGGTIAISAVDQSLDAQYVSTQPGVASGRYLRIAVEDSGTGMPPEVRDRVFEPFFTTKPIGAGTGLGLSTAAAVVRSHGGHLNVYSEPGHGTTFHLYLPRSSDAPGTPTQAPDESIPRGEGQLVLVIDDEAPIRSLVRQTLEANGYRVLEAADGADALRVFAARRDEVAVVLTDMMMPVMDGTATVHALKRIAPSIRIIGSSGLGESARAKRMTGAGIDSFLQKPFSSHELLTTIGHVLLEPR